MKPKEIKEFRPFRRFTDTGLTLYEQAANSTAATAMEAAKTEQDRCKRTQLIAAANDAKAIRRLLLKEQNRGALNRELEEILDNHPF